MLRNLTEGTSFMQGDLGPYLTRSTQQDSLSCPGSRGSVSLYTWGLNFRLSPLPFYYSKTPVTPPSLPLLAPSPPHTHTNYTPTCDLAAW